MEIREFREGDVLVLAPDGSVAGSEETAAIEATLGTALKAGFRLLVLDCSAAGQLTSAAIRVLLLASRKLDRTEGRLVLCGMNAKLAKAFAISGFDKDFTVVATRQDALQRVLEPAPRRPSRKEKASAPKGVASREVPVQPRADTDSASAVVAEAPSAAADPTPIVESAAAAPVAATTRPASAADRRHAIATAILDALGVQVAHADAARSSSVAATDLDALAGGLLAALRVGRS